MPNNPRLTIAREYLGLEHRYAETMLARMNAVDPMRGEPSEEAVEPLALEMALADGRTVNDAWWFKGNRAREHWFAEGRRALTAALAVMAGESVAMESEPGEGYISASAALAVLRGEVRAEPIAEPAPIDMILNCPSCQHQHVDTPEADWTNPPHKSHLCAKCGTIWRPCDLPTNGVAEIATRGKADTWMTGSHAPPVDPPPEWTAEQREAVLTAIKGLFVGVQNSMDVLTVRRVVFDAEQKFLAAFAGPEPVWPPSGCIAHRDICRDYGGCFLKDCPHAGERADG